MRRQRVIPERPEDLSPGWLTATMRDAGALSSSQSVVGFELAPMGEGGTGFSGDTVRVLLRYEGPGADALPSTLIAKFPTSDLVNRGMIESLGSYEREIEFYRDLAPSVPCRVPATYGSAFDPGGIADSMTAANRAVDRLPARAHLALTKDVTKFMRASKRRYVLLIEEIEGATVHDLADPPPVERIGALLDVLARIHASFWGRDDLADHRSTRTVVTDLPNTYANVYRGRCRDMAIDRWPWLSPAMLALFDEAADRFADDLAVVNQPTTLIHGDPRSDNVLYRTDDELVLLDWALPGHANPAYDVAYAMSAGIRVSDHARHSSELIGRYLAALGDHGVDLDRAEFDEAVAAAARTLLVQNLNGLAVLSGDYGTDVAMADLWVPRLLALLGEARPADDGLPTVRQ